MSRWTTELTAYMGDSASAVSAGFQGDAQISMAGVGKGWQTKEFYHWRVTSVNPYEDDLPYPEWEHSPFRDREAVKQFFKIRILPSARFCLEFDGIRHPTRRGFFRRKEILGNQNGRY